MVTALGMMACETTPTQDAAIWNKPPRYGHGGTQQRQGDTAVVEAEKKKNRFGFGGNDAAGGQAGTAASNPTANGNMAAGGNLGSTAGATNKPPVTDTKTTEKDKKKKSTTTGSGGSKASPPSNLKSYPFGKPVPGKGGFVTLPSPHDGLGEIDVRGIAPGTPVEIPDPTKPGKKIYFRVP